MHNGICESVETALTVYPSVFGVDTVSALKAPRGGGWQDFGLFGGIANVVSPSIGFV